jgi:RHS repeat-associated protein
MDGSTANSPGKTYGSFFPGVDIVDGKTTVLPWTVWMPLIDMAHAVQLPVPTTGPMVVTSPRIPGLEVHIPGNVILQTSEGPLTVVSLTRLSTERPPFPIPEGAKFLWTPQTHGAQVLQPDGTPSTVGVRFILPNVDRFPPGARVGLQSYSVSKGWYVYGHGTVTDDGQQITPDPGVQFLRVTCIFLAQTPSYPRVTSPPTRRGDPVDVSTGLFTMEKTDLVLPDVIPIVLQRQHRAGDSSVGLFGQGQHDIYSMGLFSNPSSYTVVDLVLGDGASIRFDAINPGDPLESRIWEHTASPTAWQKARVVYVASGTWARTGLPTALASATYNAANQQTAFGGVTQTFDLNGNLTGDGTLTYTWDARNRLASLSGGATASFQYDSLGRRTSKTINNTQTGFLYDGLNPVQELDGTTPIANLLTALDIDENLTRTDTTVTRSYLADALGSIVALTDSSGAVQAGYTYEPFGTTGSTGTPAGNTFDYTGRESDGTGLKFFRARYYHPTLQRFASEDPIRFHGGDTNLYAYVGSNPIGFVDPFGLERRDQFMEEEPGLGSPLIDPIDLLAGFGALPAKLTAKLALVGTSKALTFTPRLVLGNAKFGLEHILREQSFNAGLKGKSMFLRGMGHIEVRALINQAARNGAAWRVEGSSRVLETSVGCLIGTDAKGVPTSVLRVVTNANGSVITAYPVPLP